MAGGAPEQQIRSLPNKTLVLGAISSCELLDAGFAIELRQAAGGSGVYSVFIMIKEW